MQTRVPVAALLLLTGCYLPVPSSEAISTDNVRLVKVEPSTPNTSTLGISIALPPRNVDCSDVLLAIVGARRAVLGERVVLEATMSSSDEDDTEPTLRWDSEDTELTVVGPDSATMLCDTIGVHTVLVELAPPAPCPAAVRVAIDCVEANR